MRGAALAILGALVTPASAQDVAGTWSAESGRSRVQVAACGSARCGTIVWTAARVLDVNNPDPARKDRELVGLRIISDARQQGDSWIGQLYNPLDGRTYQGRMRLTGPRELELSGCVMRGLICRSQTWTRAN